MTLLCKDCLNKDGFIVTYCGMACSDCGSSNIVPTDPEGDLDPGLPLNDAGQVIELRRMMSLVDGRYEVPGIHGLAA
jgi:hypothetical protein